MIFPQKNIVQLPLNIIDRRFLEKKIILKSHYYFETNNHILTNNLTPLKLLGLTPTNILTPPLVSPEALSSIKEKLKKNDLLITSDTIVWHKNRALGKPKNRDEAFEMIKSLENSSHEVITSICISTIKSQVIVNEKTLVFFDKIDKNDLLYYTKTSDVLDRAGSYGIQDYIGHIGIKKIKGSYSNVLGFPTNLFVNTINSMNL